MRKTFLKILFWVYTTATILISALLTYFSFQEWLTVGFRGQTIGYPWGPVNENPWYYVTPIIYSRVMLTEFIVFALGLGLTIYFISKKNKAKISYSLLGLWVLMLLMLVNGDIQ